MSKTAGNDMGPAGHLERAFEIVGSQAELARRLDLSDMAISYWKTRGVPVERCADIERITGGKVKRRDLRPDVFGKVAA